LANRYIYFSDGDFYKKDSIEFTWFPGMSKTQKRKSIESLHYSAKEKHAGLRILEVSSASLLECGRNASAFNLKMTLKDGKEYSVESLFQSSKVFNLSGVNNKTLTMDSREAKRYTNYLHSKEELVSFDFFGNYFPLKPETFFYNWLYVNTMLQNHKLLSDILKYDAFTDINFNPQKSINCQAEACSIITYLNKIDCLDEKLRSPQYFLELVYPNIKKSEYTKENQTIAEQLSLFDKNYRKS
jgi:hypothetical protein